MTLRKWAGMSIISVLLCVNVFAGNETDIEALWPTRDLFSPQQIAKVFYNMSFKPYEREDLSFTMLIPKDWKSVPIKLSKKEMEKAESSSLLPLCELRAPDWNMSTAKIEVHSAKIPAGVTLRHWVDLYLKGNQLSPIARRAGTFNGRKVEDVLFRAQQGEKSFLVRTTFSCHGSRIFLVACSSLEQSFKKYAKVFSAAAISFAPQETGLEECSGDKSTEKKAVDAADNSAPVTQAAEEIYQGPPRNLVANNLSQCEVALEILVKSVELEKTYQSDEGKGGYVQCLVEGIVTKTFKGSFSTGDTLSYRFTSEYDGAPRCPVEMGRKYIVFLKHDPKSRKLWLFAEAAQFKSSSELVRILERLSESK